MKKFFKNNADNLILGFILVLAFILRVYKLPEIPFMNDEFSAIFRTNYNSFSELIEKGIKVDGHPPAIQVFLFYWIKIVGTSETWLKLPFILFGVISVFFAYKIAKEWFGVSSAVVIAIVIACLQYPIMYSQIIRPYGSGLMLILVFTYFWNKIIFHSDQNKLFNIIGFAVTGALSAYDHHFALLQVAVIGFSGLLLVKRKEFLKYILANIAIVILYLPNLSIFFAQLELKGVEGWLGKPENGFIFNYLGYIIQFSWLVGISIALIIVLGIFLKPFEITNRKLFILLSIIWFVVPFLIGFFYSKYVSAVIQYSVLIFAFPFLLFAVFGWIRNNSLKFRIIVGFVLSLICIYSLIYERKHYKIFYNSSYELIVKKAKEVTDSLGAKSCITVFSYSLNDSISTPARAFKYYANKYHYNSPYIIADSPADYKNLQISLENFKGNYVYYGYLSSANPEVYSIIKNYFPYIKTEINCAGGDLVILSRTPTDFKNENIIITNNSFEGKVADWSDYNSAFLIDSIASNGKKSYKFDSISEWGPAFVDTLFKIATKNDYVDITVDVMPLGTFTTAQLVSSIDMDTVNVEWRGSQFSNFNMKENKWTTVSLSIKLPDLRSEDLNSLIKVFIWNSEKQNFLIDNFKVCVRKGNPILYWIVNKEVESK